MTVWTQGQLVAFTPENSSVAIAKYIDHVLPSGRAVIRWVSQEVVFTPDGAQFGGIKKKHMRARIAVPSDPDIARWEKAAANTIRLAVSACNGVDREVLDGMWRDALLKHRGACAL